MGRHEEIIRTRGLLILARILAASLLREYPGREGTYGFRDSPADSHRKNDFEAGMHHGDDANHEDIP